MAKCIYTSLRPLCGKQGWEMYRFGGSSGSVSFWSDIDLLHAVKVNEGSLPRKVWATVIMRDKDKYWFAHVKCNPVENCCKYACPKYSPPRDGGPFKMPQVCLSKHPVLTEFQYIKMWTVMILECLNKYRERDDFQPVAKGPILHELIAIKKAREVYKSSNMIDWMHHFVL